MKWSVNEIRQRQWVMNNPGVMKEIAESAKVTTEYVRLVLYGARKGKTKTVMEIKRLLRRKGAPVA